MAGTLGILLAGGRGARLGLGSPKALAPFGETTLLDHALVTLRGACDEVVVSAPAELALPVPRATRADDPPDAAGPLAGLVAALRARPWSRALALGVDLPLVSARLLRALGALLEGHTAVVPVPRARTQPLAAWYAPAALEPLAAALGRGERALVPAVLALDPRLVADDELAALGAAPESFLNVNTPEDLASAVRVRGAGHRA